MTQTEQKKDLNKIVWSIANDLRGKGQMEPSEYKDYILGIVFYRYLSQKIELFLNKTIKEDTDYDSITEACKNEEIQKALKIKANTKIGYWIEPEHFWSEIVKKTNQPQFNRETLQQALNSFSEYVASLSSSQNKKFDNLFEDIELYSSKLGQTDAAKKRLIAAIIQKIDGISTTHDNLEIDALGDIYETFIYYFATIAGKKAGEFYTPPQVSELLAKIVTHERKKLKKVYDPTCGSGSLLLQVIKHLSEDDKNIINIYGQEKVRTTYNLARMNMILHGINTDSFDLVNGDTLAHPHKDHLGEKFQAIVANPPYSATWEPALIAPDDERFSVYSKKSS